MAQDAIFRQGWKPSQTRVEEAEGYETTQFILQRSLSGQLATHTPSTKRRLEDCFCKVSRIGLAVVVLVRDFQLRPGCIGVRVGLAILRSTSVSRMPNSPTS